MPFTDTTQVIYTPVGDYDDWGPSVVPLDLRCMRKLASASHVPTKIAEFADQLRARDDGRYVLLNALGAGEFYGSNKNGDYFNEWSLLGDTIPPDVKEFLREKGLPIPAEWGYKTFERYAYPYKHHDNDDPAKSCGERVCCAAYNHKMHRVELIVFIRGDKAPDVIRKIDAGDPVAFSMGARLPFDVCSICRKPARKKSDYCDHLKNMLNYIFPDGRKVYAYNYFPRFFDISIVTVPADRSAYSLRKVASYMESSEAQTVWSPGMDYTAVVPVYDTGHRETVPVSGMDKFAGLFDYLASGGTKEADIDKIVPAHPEGEAKEVKVPSAAPNVMEIVRRLVYRDKQWKQSLPPETIMSLKKYPLNKVLSGLTSLGIVLPDKDADEVIGDQELPGKLDTLAFPTEEPTLISVLKRLISRRSLFDPHFSIRIKRIHREGAEEEPKPPSLIKSGSVRRYKEWLCTQVDLEKLAERIQQPEVQLVLFPGELEKEIVGLSRDPAIGQPEALFPFIAAIGS